MKTTSLTRLFIISLVFILLLGTAEAGVFDQLEGLIQENHYSRESGKISGYFSSSQYSLLEPHLGKPDLDLFTDFSLKPKSDLAKFDVIEKDLWKDIPSSGPYCPSCALGNSTKTFGEVFTENYKSPKAEFFFGGSGGAGAPGGGGCCG